MNHLQILIIETQWSLIIERLKVDGLTVIVADHTFYYLNDIIDKVFFMENEELTVYNSKWSFKKRTYDTRSFDLFWLNNRIESETKLNSYSSRSHSILIFEVTQNLNNANFYKKGTLNLVDLAGREKI